MDGWIKDYRKELSSDIWKFPPLYHRVWQYLKYKANHKDNLVPTRQGYIMVKRGQTITSYRNIAKAVAWEEYGTEKIPSAKTIKVILDILVHYNMIVRSSNTRGTLINIINYDKYQGSDEDDCNTEETPRKHSLPTNKKDKERKEKIYAPKQKEYEVFFEEVWKEYPNKIGKKDVKPKDKKELYKLGKEHVMRSLNRYKEEIKDKEKQYILGGGKFFKNRIYDYLDDVYTEVPKTISPAYRQLGGE